MTIRYLLDTNVLSEGIKSYPNARTLERLSEYDGERSGFSSIHRDSSYEPLAPRKFEEPTPVGGRRL